MKLLSKFEKNSTYLEDDLFNSKKLKDNIEESKNI